YGWGRARAPNSAGARSESDDIGTSGHPASFPRWCSTMLPSGRCQSDAITFTCPKRITARSSVPRLREARVVGGGALDEAAVALRADPLPVAHDDGAT